jgi:hypothetical protein
MKRNRTVWSVAVRVCGVVAVIAACALPASAQSAQSVTNADIQRLQDQVYQASGELSRLRNTNPDIASNLQTDLDDLRDEVAYLKVKMRREGSVNRTDYTDVRDRLQALRSRATGDARSDNQGGVAGTGRTGAGSSGANSGISGGVNGGVGSGSSSDARTSSPQSSRAGTQSDDRTRSDQGTSTARSGSNNSVIPTGQELDVRLESELSSATAQVEQRFEATTVADLYQGNRVLIPAGSTVRGIVSGVTKTTRMERKGSLTVAFDQLTVNGRDYPIRGTVTQAIESEGIKGETNKIGAGAGVGAIIGGILGGIKGAVLGVLIGGGGTVAATEGKDVTLPAGTILRVRLDTPPAIR